MSVAGAARSGKARWRGAVRRLLRRLAVLAGLLVLAPLVLTPLYRYVPPVSTLMVYDWVRLQPVRRHWVPLDEIAPVLVHAVVMSEDARYCAHRGIDWQEVRNVFADLSGRPRGASTIPMQTVKNLFLWSSRSYVRKVFEVPLAFYADLVLGKRRLAEIYLNVVEWGPGIYGAEAAARHHFGRPASRLSARQAALLAATLPAPHVRDPARPGPVLNRLAERAARQGRLAGGYTDCVLP